MKLISDADITRIMQAFWDKYRNKGLTASEVYELHFSELWQGVAQAQLDSCKLEHERLLEQISMTLKNEFDSRLASCEREAEEELNIIADKHKNEIKQAIIKDARVYEERIEELEFKLEESQFHENMSNEIIDDLIDVKNRLQTELKTQLSKVKVEIEKQLQIDSGMRIDMTWWYSFWKGKGI